MEFTDTLTLTVKERQKRHNPLCRNRLGVFSFEGTGQRAAGGNGGCDTGFGSFALLAAAGILFVRGKRGATEGPDLNKAA